MPRPVPPARTPPPKPRVPRWPAQPPAALPVPELALQAAAPGVTPTTAILAPTTSAEGNADTAVITPPPAATPDDPHDSPAARAKRKRVIGWNGTVVPDSRRSPVSTRTR
jgi:hypothetical protein